MLGPDAVHDIPSSEELEQQNWWITGRERIIGLILLSGAVVGLFQVVVNHGIHDAFRILAAVAGILLGLGTLGYFVRLVIPPAWKRRWH